MRGFDSDLAKAVVINKLPDVFGRHDIVPTGLAGSTIVQVGTFEDAGLVETGGLVIDYRRPDSGEIRRLVLAFNDTSMWSAGDQAL